MLDRSAIHDKPRSLDVGKCIGAIEATAAIKSCELPIELERSEP
jgi:hypothetical protein